MLTLHLDDNTTQPRRRQIDCYQCYLVEVVVYVIVVVVVVVQSCSLDNKIYLQESIFVASKRSTKMGST